MDEREVCVCVGGGGVRSNLCVLNRTIVNSVAWFG